MELTKITNKFAVTLYKQYLESIKSGIPRTTAIEFNNLSLPDFSDDDIDYCIDEMKKHRYIKVDILGNITLQPNFIYYMENRFKSDLSEVVNFLANIASNII